MNGCINERIINKGKNKNGKTVNNLKVYDVFYRFRDPATGKLKQTSKKGFRTKGDAENFILKINTQMGDNTFSQPDKILFRDYLKYWLDVYVNESNLRKTTIAGYLVNINGHVIPSLGNIELQNLTASHIENFYAQKLKNGRLDGKGGLSAKSIKYIHRVLSKALDHALKKRLTTRNVAKEVSIIPKVKKYHAEIYNKQEIRLLLGYVKDTDMEVPIALAAICGLRRGEVLGLKWCDINFENCIVKICRQLIPTKDGFQFEAPKSETSNRVCSVPEEIINILARHRKNQDYYRELLGIDYNDNDLINCNPDGSLISPSYFSKRFSTVIKNAGLKHIRFHDLRHSCASLMLLAGVQMKVASDILGHSSIGITADLYTHVITDLKKEAALKGISAGVDIDMVGLGI